MTSRPIRALNAWNTIGRRSTPAARLVHVSLMFAALGCSVAQGWTSAEISRQVFEAERAGGNVVVVSSDGGSSIVASECDRLATGRSDVAASGSIRDIGTVTALSAPSNGVQAGFFSGDFLAVASGEDVRQPTGPGVVLGVRAATTLGASPTSRVGWTDGEWTPVVEIVNFDARDEGFNIWRMEMNAPGTRADACWIEAKPGLRASVVASVLAGLPSSPEASVNVFTAESPAEAIDPSLLKARRWIPVFGAVTALALLVILGLVNRQSSSLLRLIGMDSISLLVFGWLVASWIVMAMCLACAACFTVLINVAPNLLDRSGLVGIVPMISIVLTATPIIYASRRRNPLLDLRDR